MANTPADDVVTMLENDGVGTAGTDLFVNKEPQKNSSPIAAIYDTGGYDPDATGKVYDKPTVMARVKGVDGGITAATALIQSIKSALHGREPETISGSRYKGIWQVGDIMFVEYDERNRPVFSANFRLQRTY